MTDSELPIGGKASVDKIKELYIDASGDEVSDEIDKLPKVEGPFGIVDPRYMGYTYLSYMFVETGGELEAAREATKDVFEDPHKALMMGVVLGEFDIIHRRADTSQYMHAAFSVRAQDNKELRFLKSIETYPIFTIGRWHGQNVRGRMTMRNPPRELTPLESEILRKKINSPNANPSKIRKEIINDIDRELYSPVEKSDIESLSLDSIHGTIGQLEEQVLLGKSISVDVSGLSGFNHVITGISVAEREKEQRNDLMPNEEIMQEMMDNWDGWEMPYLVSGVGQSWADIIAEMHINEVRDMNEIAEEMREIDGIQSTRTMLVAEQNFDTPLIIDDPNLFSNIGD